MLESLENNLIEVKNASSELTLHSFERRKECLEILYKLIKTDGLFLGTSSGVNIIEGINAH